MRSLMTGLPRQRRRRRRRRRRWRLIKLWPITARQIGARSGRIAASGAGRDRSDLLLLARGCWDSLESSPFTVYVIICGLYVIIYFS